MNDTIRLLVLMSLGLLLYSGCGETAAPPDSGKQASDAKKLPKFGDAAGSESAPAASEPANPHGVEDPHANMSAGVGQEIENNGKLDLETLHFTVPKSWIRKTPMSPILQAEYSVPKAEGDANDGRLTLSMARGTLEDNVARWKGQFSKKLEQDNSDTIDAGAVKITLVDMSGTFDDTRGMMGPTVTRPDYRMMGAIFKVDGEDGLHFVKFYGPKKTMTARADEFKGFLRSLKVDK